MSDRDFDDSMLMSFSGGIGQLCDDLHIALKPILIHDKICFEESLLIKSQA